MVPVRQGRRVMAMASSGGWIVSENEASCGFPTQRRDPGCAAPAVRSPETSPVATEPRRAAARPAREPCTEVGVGKLPSMYAVAMGSRPEAAASPLAELSRSALRVRLGGVPAFTELSDTARHALAELARPHSFRRGETILREGEHSSSFFVLLSGRVKMCRALPNGRDVLLALFGPGELFGTVAALGAASCNASIVALARTLCLEIRRDDLFLLFERQPALVAELLPLLTQQLVECKNCIVELSCYRVEMRFAQLLLKLADNVGQSREAGTFIPIPLSRRELADMTGTSIETCIRVMSRWGKESVVETLREGFLVANRAALEEAAQG